MPGTIQVSVLDFMGLQSDASPPSEMSIKVSMGKREYETWDKGEFSFPLTTLRDNLMVTLQDAQGNELSHTGVEARLVIEKGLWDDIFPLEGGGHVRMKLQFVLSEEDRHRIRLMRELALKKKKDELVYSEPRSPEYAPAVDNSTASSSQPKHEVSDSTNILQSEVVTTQASLVSIPPYVSKSGKSFPDDREGMLSVQKQKSPNDPDRYEDTSSITPVSRGFVAREREESKKSSGEKRGTGSPPNDIPKRTPRLKEALYFRSSESEVAANDKISGKLKRVGDTVQVKQSLLEKTPSNVRNMITAFESSPNKEDTKPNIRSTPMKSASKRPKVEVPLKSSLPDEAKTDKNKQENSSSWRIRNPYHTGDVQGASKHIRKGEEHVGFVGELSGATLSQDTGKLEEKLRDACSRTQETNVNLKNKLKVIDKADRRKEKTSKELFRASTSEKASVSGRMVEEHLDKGQYSELLAGKENSGANLLITRSGKGSLSKYSERVNIQTASREKHYSSECYGAWIFPDERRLCITTAGTKILNLMGGFWDEAEGQSIKMSSSVVENIEECSVHGSTGVKSKEGEKTSQINKKSTLQGSMEIDAESSRGPVGQVVRIAIMVGFATLVLLTRQKSR